MYIPKAIKSLQLVQTGKGVASFADVDTVTRQAFLLLSPGALVGRIVVAVSANERHRIDTIIPHRPRARVKMLGARVCLALTHLCIP